MTMKRSDTLDTMAAMSERWTEERTTLINLFMAAVMLKLGVTDLALSMAEVHDTLKTHKIEHTFEEDKWRIRLGARDGFTSSAQQHEMGLDNP